MHLPTKLYSTMIKVNGLHLLSTLSPSLQRSHTIAHMTGHLVRRVTAETPDVNKTQSFSTLPKRYEPSNRELQ